MKEISNNEMLQLIMQRLDNRESDYFSAITELKQDIKDIKKQTTETNGRVTRLEIHENNCPIDDIKKQTEVIRFFVKYPKIFYFMAAIIGIVIGINGTELIIDLLKAIK